VWYRVDREGDAQIGGFVLLSLECEGERGPRAEIQLSLAGTRGGHRKVIGVGVDP